MVTRHLHARSTRPSLSQGLVTLQQAHLSEDNQGLVHSLQNSTGCELAASITCRQALQCASVIPHEDNSGCNSRHQKPALQLQCSSSDPREPAQEAGLATGHQQKRHQRPSQQTGEQEQQGRTDNSHSGAEKSNNNEILVKSPNTGLKFKS